MQQRVSTRESVEGQSRMEELEPEVVFLLRRLRRETPAVYRDSIRVADYVRKLSEAQGDSESEVLRLYRSALLHDIGVLQVREGDSAEYVKAYMDHPLRSVEQLEALIERGLIDREAVLHHHENLDGSGYPFGLMDKQLSKGAKLLRCAISFTKMTELDPKTGSVFGTKEAIHELYRWSGIIFDEKLVERAGPLWTAGAK